MIFESSDGFRMFFSHWEINLYDVSMLCANLEKLVMSVLRLIWGGQSLSLFQAMLCLQKNNMQRGVMHNIQSCQGVGEVLKGFETNLGEMSHPCCIKAPRENQRLLKMPNSLGGWSLGPSFPSSGSSVCHSYGLNLLTRNKTTLTPMQAKTMHIQISQARGSKKENTPGLDF